MSILYYAEANALQTLALTFYNHSQSNWNLTIKNQGLSPITKQISKPYCSKGECD